MAKLRLKLDNRTRWDTRDLRRFVLAGLKHCGVDGYWTVRIASTRQPYGSSGLAYVNSHWFQINIPAYGWSDNWRSKIQLVTLPAVKLREVGQVLEHEVAHCRGLHHGEMRPSEDIPATWTLWLSIRKQAPKIKKTRTATERAGARESKAREKLAEWERKQRAAARKVKTYRAKVRYYDRKHERAAASPGMNR